MDRVAVFVDAGYLFAQGSLALVGQRLPRGSVILNYEKALEALEAFAQTCSTLPLLRIYWYDGTSTGPTPQQIALAHFPRVKVRLGFVNSVGSQKGVDSLIVTDMINLARNRAMADAVLLSGDEDIRVGVQQAQEFGVRVHLLGIRPSRGSQSLFLLQEADSTHEWGPEDLRPFLSCRIQPSQTPVVQPGPATTAASQTVAEQLALIATGLAREIPETELRTLVAAIKQSGQTPKDIDGRLLAKGGAALRTRLDSAQKRAIRAAFLQACESRLSESARREPQDA